MDRPLIHHPFAGTSRDPVLLSVRDAREEIAAGYGNALCLVRTLDGVSCDVRAGELLLLSGGAGSGAGALLRVLRGTPIRGHALRDVRGDVQLRRGAVPAFARDAILEGWETFSIPSRPLEIVRAPTVYLLRVRSGDHRSGPAAAASPSLVASWRHWAGQLRVSGGAIVLMDAARSYAAQGDIAKQRASDGSALSLKPQVREESRQNQSAVRTLTLHAGRVVSADPGSHPR